jgi:hypothetical protein
MAKKEQKKALLQKLKDESKAKEQKKQNDLL